MIELRDDGLEVGLPGDRDVLRYEEDMILHQLTAKSVKTKRKYNER